MDKQQLKELINMLGAQWEMDHETAKLFYLKYIEIACDRTNEETYILKDLNLLAEVLEEMELTYLIETIEIYDMPSAQVLDYLVAE